MADNITLNSGTGGSNLRTDDDGTAHWQYVKLAFGADNTQTIVSAANPLPVDVDTNTAGLMTGSEFTTVLGTASLVTTAVLADAIATSQDVLNVRNFNYVFNGTTFDLVREGSTAGSILVDGSGVTQPVSGTVTANLGATDNAVLDSIDAAVNGTLTVDLSTNNDVQGATAEGAAVAGNPFLIAGDDGTSVKHIAVDASGNVQVDLVTADVTNAGTFAVQAAQSGTWTVDLGANNDVTIDASSIVHAEDAVHGSGDAGVMSLAVRNDDLAALAGTDGDYAPLQVSQNGALLMCPAANDDYKYAVIDDATSGDNTLIAAVASRKIRVLAAFMVSAGAVNARFEDGAAGTALTGQMNLVANSGFTLPFNPAGWFETSVNTLLNLELSAAISVDGSITYIEVP